MGVQVAQDTLGIWENKSEEEVAILKKLNVYPSSSIISDKDYQAIVAYYTYEAPTVLPKQLAKLSPEPLLNFTVNKLFVEGIEIPKTSLVAIDEERKDLIIGYAATNQLYIINQHQELFTLPTTTSPAVAYIKKAPNVYNFITVGSIAPSDLARGGLYQMDLNAEEWSQVMDKLPRPVYGAWEDLEKDGKTDFVLCNYGNHGGNIAIYSDGNLRSKPILLGGAGARKVEFNDLNQDGKLDIVALFCQGNERISVFYSKGNGEYEPEKVLLRFPPVMGSDYFELQDLNGDGLPDILISNGDNWDYSAVLKPYHGYRIYENKGNGLFEEAWFYPHYGAAKAMTVDIDNDGDLDLATITFFDELENPEEQFLLFENKGNMVFEPKVIADAALGKWLTMDVGDLDGDGDKDIVLGAYAHNVMEYTKLLLRGIEKTPSVLILENKLK